MMKMATGKVKVDFTDKEVATEEEALLGNMAMTGITTDVTTK